ncbi:hypothetical protein AKJ45_00255 [candidate division MSBL1 archaeon SCGC-AAA261F19]|uniref:Glycosyltransferase subfamily 4-like N-terminal domain-containing protein n=1 Tax=candidate division MSBL1 archaeon SCGC-AAA261F19 TaxID=1698275 RepID=A0A133VBK6_9EURY|nr:hypothetical protein AKJ45_00255 [candidate division MSBL1 archaeon SCGC-AAA261F19]
MFPCNQGIPGENGIAHRTKFRKAKDKKETVMRRILISLKNFDPPLGGAELSMRALAERLAEDHEVHVIFSGSRDDDYRKLGCNLHRRRVKNLLPGWLGRLHMDRRWKRLLDEALDRKPDLLLTQGSVSPGSVGKASELGCPNIVFLRSYEHFCPLLTQGGRDLANCKDRCLCCVPPRRYLDYPFFLLKRRLQRDSLSKASLVLANSRFMKRVTEMRFSLNTHVVNPFVKISKYRTGKERGGEKIGMVNPMPHKGGEIVVELAKRMGGRDFLVVGKGPPRTVEMMKRLPNVEYSSWVEDMREVYEKVKLVLVPSLWQEPFCRVVVESISNGVPCIVSDRGALPEVVGGGGSVVEKPESVDEWKKKIEEMDDKVLYKEKSEKAKRRSKKFSFESSYEDFKDKVRGNLGISLGG